MLFGLVSCDNFMQSGNVRKEIEDAIAFNNAASCDVIFRMESKTGEPELGEFLGTTERTLHQGYDTEVQFEINVEDYAFVTLEAVSQNDKTTSRNDCVKFEQLEADNTKGKYKYKVTLLTQAKDILIRPVCIARPRITGITPDSLYVTYNQDSVIKFTFNKPLNKESLNDFSYYIFAESDLTTKFETPSLSEDGQTLYIRPKTGEHILPPNESKGILNVQISYDFTNVTDKDSLLLTAKGTHEYKINKNFTGEQIATVYIPVENTMGYFSVSGEKSCTVGYTYELQYTLINNNYTFIDFEAVSNKDNSVSRNNSVSFENKSYNSEIGVFKTKLLVNELQDDILVRPKCLLIPAVSSHVPVNNSMQYINKPVTISFNMPISEQDAAQFTYTYEEDGKTENGPIMISGVDNVQEYFEPPVFSNDRTSLILQPKFEKFNEYFEKYRTELIEIEISLSDSIKISQGDIILPLKQDKESSFKIKYKTTIENNPPVKNKDGFFVTGHKISLENAVTLEENKKFTQEIFDVSSRTYSASEAQIKKNRAGNILYIYGNYYDGESGVSKVLITEQRTNEFVFGTEVQDKLYDDIEYTKNDTDKAEFLTNENGDTVFCIPHKLKSQDGAISVTVTVVDAAGNPAQTQSLIVIKRTNVAFWDVIDDVYGILDLGIYNIPRGMYGYDYEGNYIPLTFDVYKQNYKTLYIYNWDGAFTFNIDAINHGYPGTPYDLYGHVYANIWIPSKEFKVWCEYKKNGITQKIPFVLNNNMGSAGCWQVNLDVDSVAGLNFDVIFENDLGVSSTLSYAFPSKPFITSVEQKSDYTEVKFNNSVYVVTTDEQNTASMPDWPVNTVDVYPNKEYRIFPASDDLLGQIEELKLEELSVPEIEIKNVTYARTRPNMLDVTITIEDDTWEKFDEVVIDDNIYFNKGEFTKTIDLTGNKSQNLFNYKKTVKVYGIKNSVYSQAAEWEIDKITDSSLDYIAPYGSKGYTEYGFISFTINDEINNTDYAIGPDYGVLTVNKKTFRADETTGYTVKIPFWLVYQNRIAKENMGQLSIAETPLPCTIYDKNGNFGEDDRVFYFEELHPKIAAITNTDGNSWNIITEKNKADIFTNKYAPREFSEKNQDLGVYKLNEDGSWESDSCEELIFTKTTETVDGEKLYTYSATGATLPDNSYVMLFWGLVSFGERANYTDLSAPSYFYTGSASTGDYDLLMANGTSTSSVAISSDKPVFAHTLVTSKSYDECKNWSVGEWEYFNKDIGNKYLDFTTNHNPQRYLIPVSEIDPGECYVVIAHFADGSTAMSEVMQR